VKRSLGVAVVAFAAGYLLGGWAPAGAPIAFEYVPGLAGAPQPPATPAQGSLSAALHAQTDAAHAALGAQMEAVAAAGEKAEGSTAAAADEPPVEDQLRRYEAALQSGRSADAVAVRDRLLDRARAWSAAGSGGRAIELLDALIALDPYDAEARFAASDILQQQGRLPEAIDPLLAVLAQGAGVEGASRARELLRRIVDVHEIQLANRRDPTGLVRFFEDLVVRDPAWDGHRLRLARWLLELGRTDEAEQVEREMGSAGVTDAEREDLLAAIRLARDGLPLEYGARGLHVRATIAGQAVRLLVDTGASTTVLSAGLTRALGSQAQRKDVGVRTAGGLVRGELHRVRDLRVGGLHLPELEVLVLADLPDDADGLLGMDVLGRLPAGALPATLLGRPPVSG